MDWLDLPKCRDRELPRVNPMCIPSCVPSPPGRGCSQSPVGHHFEQLTDPGLDPGQFRHFPIPRNWTIPPGREALDELSLTSGMRPVTLKARRIPARALLRNEQTRLLKRPATKMGLGKSDIGLSIQG